MSPTARRVPTATVELAAIESGQGGRPLLVAHGLTGAKEDFADHLERFAASGWHMVVPDLRGHGESDAPAGEGEYGLEILAGDLVGAAGALGWDRFALMGHSMGGMVAQRVAIGCPGRLTALVLMDTHHGAVGVDRAMALGSVELVRDRGMGALADLVAAMGGGGLLQVPAHRPHHSREAWAALTDRKLRASSPAMYVAMVAEMLDQGDRLAALAALAVPTLVLCGEHDHLFSEPSRRLARAIPGARLELVAGAGHSPQHEAPQAWAVAVLSFLDAAGPGGAS